MTMIDHRIDSAAWEGVPTQSDRGNVPPPPDYPPRAGAPQSMAARSAVHGYWWKTLLGGLALWVMTVIITILTRNANLVPTLILVGSFLVPFSATLLAIQKTAGRINPTRLLMAFFVGGIFGVLGASILEAKVSGDLSSLLAAGFIEEAVKLAVVAFAATRIVHRTPALGAWLGAVVGAGFSAFESAGYALNSSITHGGINLIALLQTEALRGLLSPVGHILWTAIAGAALFAVLGRLDAGRTAHLAATVPGARRHMSGRVALWVPMALTYLGVAVLHSAWDLAGNFAAYVAVAMTGVGRYKATYGFTPEAVVAEAQTLAGALYIAGVAVVTVVGVAWLLMSLLHGRASHRRQRAQSWKMPVDGRQGLSRPR